MKKVLITLFAIIYLSHNVSAQEFENKIDSLIEKAVQLNRFNGSVLVSKNGKIIYEKAYGYQDAEKHILNTTNTIYQIGSTTKEFTAAVILKLAEQHKLSLEDKLSKYFPDYKRGNEITIKHLLTHTSGIYEILRDHTAVMESTMPRSKERMLSFFIKKPLKMKHTGFDFAGLNDPDKAVGYTKYTQKIHEASVPWDSTATFSAGSLYSTVKDLYLWHKGLL